MSKRTPDMEKFRALLGDYDITDEERDEFVRVMWSLCQQFVDMGFGVENTQLVLKEIWEKAGVFVDENPEIDYNNLMENNKKKDLEP